VPQPRLEELLYLSALLQRVLCPCSEELFYLSALLQRVLCPRSEELLYLSAFLQKVLRPRIEEQHIVLSETNLQEDRGPCAVIIEVRTTGIYLIESKLAWAVESHHHRWITHDKGFLVESYVLAVVY